MIIVIGDIRLESLFLSSARKETHSVTSGNGSLLLRIDGEENRNTAIRLLS